MRIKFLFLVIISACACSSLPIKEKSELNEAIIQKPKLDYKVNSLPETINIYFSQGKDDSKLPPEIQGFITNSYYYNSKISYTPKIILTPVGKEKCEINDELEDLYIVFDLKYLPLSAIEKNCFEDLPKSKTIYISNKEVNGNYSNNLLVSRSLERDKLIDSIPQNIKRIALIDSKKIDDQNKLISLLEDKSIEIVESKTFDGKLSSQEIFSTVLLESRSKERARKISRRLSRNLVSSNRIRQDIDGFFFSVDLKDARSLKPALDYISESNFDIFILNSWKSNDIYRVIDKDLVGTFNSDLPIMMPIELPIAISKDNRTREFAIGYDTYEIILIKYGSVRAREYNYQGLSGKFKIKNGQVYRSSYLFKITNNGIEIL